MNITVLGAGAWGTALAIALAERHPVMVWDRNADIIHAAEKSRENKAALPGFKLPEQLRLTAVFEAALDHIQDKNSLLFVATSVAGLRPVTENLKRFSIPNLVWLCKGFEENTGRLPHQVVSEIIPDSVSRGVLSGPSFAQEVAAGLPCALTIASDSSLLQQQVIGTANFGNMRIYSSDDVTGVEVGGAIKNILAIATGLSDGMGLGTNARAALMTRGLAEITRLGIALGGRQETFMGLTGMGDLILTCTGDLSRNRQVGLALAKGMSLDVIVAELGHVAEGVRCAQAVRTLAKEHQVEMPIANAVAGVLFDGISPREMLARLLARDARNEADHAYGKPV
ncbi:NAD(P)-dependent glycerol-3-phosphate dehydrogenase [Oxalobacter vibrioformis]|uniref:Glycerol-3-phosphate dehydrogenase [NAD(P)+] n=1 Tax=Oxalobacter vibrioformis TaxID=933080 RepID=A0A9E9M0X7_9BURK|nr:NAD(P)H-dependent glycerol-3-phosphate dehydrogenase [Oxalobacter vibrioformis]WAW11154.1 NAD(P)-dependent glycerol-3-phosphate dehydrogenase [Oxalobacter vibrioformis]